MTTAPRTLVCEALRLDGADSSRLTELIGTTDVGAAISLAERAAVLPTLAWTLAFHGIARELASDMRAALQDALAHNAAQNSLLLHDLARLQHALDEARVECVAIKGAALLATDARAAACRQTDDIDLLVDVEDVERARSVAFALGCREAPHPTLLDHCGHHMQHSHHAPQMVMPSGTPLELHFRVGLARRRARRQLVEGSRRVRVLDAEVTIPSVHELSVQLSRHVLIQHGAEARYLPRHVQDLHLLGESAFAYEPSTALSWALLRAAAAPPGTATRRAAEAILFPSRGSLTLEKILRPAYLATTVEAYDGAAWLRRLFPSRAYLAQTEPQAMTATSWHLALLYARRFQRFARTFH